MHIRTLHQGSGFKPYTDKEQWVARAKYLREQALMASGLWPLPDKCDLKPVIHGKLDKGDYTVEKVSLNERYYYKSWRFFRLTWE